jgi:citrate synthase
MYGGGVNRSLSATEAAHRLGVKPETLYAYVSRGVIRRSRAPDGRRSLFAEADIDRLADRARHGRPTGSFEIEIATSVTEIGDGVLRYRGHSAVDLAKTAPFEAVAELLWGGELSDSAPWRAPRDSIATAAAALRPVAPDAPVINRLLVATSVLGACDPLRDDIRPPAVAAVGRSLIAGLADLLVERRRVPELVIAGQARRSSMAGRIAAALAGRSAVAPAELAPIANYALVLLADHELATSTMAARVAASTRADPYACVVAGLAALAGPLHGSASRAVHRLFCEVERAGGAAAVLGDIHRRGARVPGFGHRVYKTDDPRAVALLDRLGSLPLPRARLAVVDDVLATAGERVPVRPNIDLAFGALSYAAGLAEDAGEMLMGVGRIAGWLAHAIEEYDAPPVRYRALGRYVGPGGGA